MKNFRRRSRQRGFSSAPQIFELAMVVTWFGVTMAGSKYLDNTITQRRAAESAAQDSIHASASPCQSLPAGMNLGSIGATSQVNLASIDSLGLETAMLPPVPALGVSYQQAFPSQQTPLRHTTSSAVSTRTQAEDLPNGAVTQSVKTVLATRQLSCQDIPQPTPTPDLNIKALSTTIWTRNVMGY
jgi:hypothetical protein